MFATAKYFSVADSLPKGAGAGVLRTVSHHRPPRLAPPPALIVEIDEIEARIRSQKPETLIDAEPALASIEVFWIEEIRSQVKAALEPLAAQGILIHANNVKSQAEFQIEFLVRGFPTREANTPALRALLFDIFAKVRRGQFDLFADTPVEPPPCPSRRWTLRWWKNFFRSCLDCCWRAGRGRASVSAATVPPVSSPAPVNEPKRKCSGDICSPS